MIDGRRAFPPTGSPIFRGSVFRCPRCIPRPTCSETSVRPWSAIFGEGRDPDGDKVERSETLQGIPDARRVEDIIRRLMEERTVPAAW